MKIKELRQSSKEELKRILGEKKEELQSFRFKTSKGKVSNQKQSRELRKDIARILTLLKNTN